MVTVPVTVLLLLLLLLLLLPLSVPLLFMAFPGVPLAGRAVVNGASEAVSALAGF
ncbi:transporter, partial [Escherichia coli]